MSFSGFDRKITESGMMMCAVNVDEQWRVQMALTKLAGAIKRKVRSNFLSEPHRLVCLENYNGKWDVVLPEYKGKPVESFALAFQELQEAGVLQKENRGSCLDGHVVCKDTGDMLLNSPETRQTWLNAQNAEEDLYCDMCSDPERLTSLYDLFWTESWVLHPLFEEALVAYKAKSALVEYCVDTGAEAWQVAIRASNPSGGRLKLSKVEVVEELIPEMVSDGLLLECRETAMLYVTKWYPRTIDEVLVSNKEFALKKV